MPSFNFNNIYEPVFTTDKRYIDIRGGRGRGGSHFGTDYFLFLLTQPSYFRGYFIRKTLNDIKDSLLQDIKDRIEENESLDINDFKINEGNYSLVYKPTGNKIISKGICGDKKRTAKLKSLAGATHVLIEEADELAESEFNQLDLSLRTTKTKHIQILRIYNQPPKNHWIYRDYNLIDSDIEGWFTAEPKSDSDVLSIFSTYEDNIENLNQSTVTILRKFKDSDFYYYLNQVLGLISEGLKGRIYAGWHHITNADFEKLELPYVYVIDFGYSGDPNALIQVKYDKQTIYIKELLYETGLDNLALAKRFHELGIKPNDIIMGDPGNGGDVRMAELRRGWTNLDDYPDLSFSVFPTVKTKIKVGINKVKSNTIYMTESSKNGWYENQEYKWALDANGNPTDIPIDKDNHIMDAVRYFELSRGRYY